MEIHVPASKCGLVIGKGTQLIYIIYKDSVEKQKVKTLPSQLCQDWFPIDNYSVYVCFFNLIV